MRLTIALALSKTSSFSLDLERKIYEEMPSSRAGHLLRSARSRSNTRNFYGTLGSRHSTAFGIGDLRFIQQDVHAGWQRRKHVGHNGRISVCLEKNFR